MDVGQKPVCVIMRMFYYRLFLYGAQETGCDSGGFLTQGLKIFVSATTAMEPPYNASGHTIDIWYQPLAANSLSFKMASPNVSAKEGYEK